ncbi:hypothetical protein SDC9_146476 [bioreactor metagenome]|uniref:Uncharacterized protein n=1 Tax=bioreactor metagenome TaxID=1076179 RepID=A0A645ECR7_9ZZZZ
MYTSSNFTGISSLGYQVINEQPDIQKGNNDSNH